MKYNMKRGADKLNKRANVGKESMDIMNIVGLIIVSILAFTLPVIGLVPGIYLLMKRRNYPTSIKIIAITAIVYQVIMIIFALLGFYVFTVSTSTDHIEISDVTTKVQK